MTTMPRPTSRLSIRDVAARKGKEPLVVLTAYTAPFARILDAHADVLLVGDSLGMVLYGMDSTLAVTLDMMINHGRAVVKASEKACVIVDMPFGSYQASPEQAFAACARVMAETGAAGVKLEGGGEMAETIAFLVARGIPVMGHVGLMPQHFNALGGFRYQGRDEAERRAITENARAVAQAGAFAMVLEGIAEDLAQAITREVAIPTIGIGASSACDGQVLVTEDMAGLMPRVPKFVKQYGQLGAQLDEAVRAYAEAVRGGSFPGPEHVFGKK